jgi:hypothetical protein
MDARVSVKTAKTAEMDDLHSSVLQRGRRSLRPGRSSQSLGGPCCRDSSDPSVGVTLDRTSLGPESKAQTTT